MEQSSSRIARKIVSQIRLNGLSGVVDWDTLEKIIEDAANECDSDDAMEQD